MEAEEAGEKWRAGDSAKSSRFFVRAIELYDAGLECFPDSFDLSYNKYLLLVSLVVQTNKAKGSSAIRYLATAATTGTIACLDNRTIGACARISPLGVEAQAR